MKLTAEWMQLPEGRVRARKDGRVAWLEMSVPPANNYSYEMMRDLDQGVLAARFDDEVDVIVLTGAGDRFFCSGADIGMLSAMSPRYKYFFCLHANETMLRLEHTPKLVIAAINGHCVGGGYEVALACDLRIARRPAQDAKPFKIGLPEVNLGVLPGTGGTQRLARLAGRARAIEWMAEARLFEADEAQEAGLVSQVFDFDGFREAVQEKAMQFTVPGKAALAVGNIKRAVLGGCDLPLEAGLGLERELQAALFASQDAQEGLAAFQERRKPQFGGR